MSFWWPIRRRTSQTRSEIKRLSGLFIVFSVFLGACALESEATPTSVGLLFATVTPTSTKISPGAAEFSPPTPILSPTTISIASAKDTPTPSPIVTPVAPQNNTETPSPSPTFTSTLPPAPTPTSIPDPQALIPVPISPKQGDPPIECDPGESSREIFLKWSPVSSKVGNTRYEIKISESGSEPATGGPTEKTEFPYRLGCSGTYEWQVRSIDGNGNPSQWSTPQTFSSKYRDTEGPTPPNLISPGNSSKNGLWVQECNNGERVPVNFQWSPSIDESGVAGYFFAIRGDQDSSWPNNPDYVEAESVTKEVVCGYRYAWAVRAVDGLGNYGDWSIIYRIYVGPDTWPPPAPTLISPPSGEPYMCQPGREEIGVEFFWNRVNDPDVDYYYFQLREIYDNEKSYTLENTRTRDTYYNYGNLPCHQAYYAWRVGVQDKSGNQPQWSEWRWFTVSKRE